MQRGIEVKVRLRTMLAVPATVLLVAAAAACSSKSAIGSSRPGDSGSPYTIPATSSVALSETGSTLLYPLFDAWGPAFHEKYSNVTISTADTSSATGIAQAAAGTVNIGASDSYLSDTEMAAHRGLLNIPLAISAQQINYNLPDVTEHLKLNGKVLAAMYRGEVKTWNDPQIAALNPGVNLPPIPVVPLHRSDGSGDTFRFTQYLSKQDPDGWGRSPGFGTTVDFPAVPGASGQKGNGGMVAGCADSIGCVAYIGISYLDQANHRGLGKAQLGNASGNFVLPDAKSIKAAAAGFTKTPANQAISLINGSAPDGYPIVNYEYAIVKDHQNNDATAQTVQAFLHWAVTEGNGASFLDEVHFQPLPSAVVKLSDAQIATISG